MIFAINGKGGVGKTTIAALLIRRLIHCGKKPVLAIDADPNSCLDASLGVTAAQSIGSIREETRLLASKGAVSGVDKTHLLHLKINQCLIEHDDFDYLAMGRPEGPGCYCYANNVLKSSIEKLAGSYPYTVIDNEAGCENLSRRIVQNIDACIMVTDPSMQGAHTLRRLLDLVRDMEIRYTRLVIIVNRMKATAPAPAMESLGRDLSADLLLGIPEDGEILKASERGMNIFSLSPGNPSFMHIDSVLQYATK